MSATEQRSSGWWITDLPDTEDCGPYARKADAESDRRGMDRFFHYEKREGFVTSDPVIKKGKHPENPDQSPTG